MLTEEQKNVLAHMVVNPEEWYAHAVSVFGAEIAERHMVAKVARWNLEYESKRFLPNYQSRAERDYVKEQKASIEAMTKGA